jgi:hypothetical protein
MRLNFLLLRHIQMVLANKAALIIINYVLAFFLLLLHFYDCCQLHLKFGARTGRLHCLILKVVSEVVHILGLDRLLRLRLLGRRLFSLICRDDQRTSLLLFD